MGTIKKFPYLVVIVIVMFVTGISFYRTIISIIKSSTPVALGEEDEREEDEDEEDEEDERGDNDENDDKDDDNEENEDEDDDSDDDEDDRSEYRRSTRLTTQPINQDDEEDEDIDEDEQDDDGIQEDIRELERDVLKYDARLSALAATGQDISAFSQILAKVRSQITEARSLIATQPSRAEQLLEEAEHKLERSEKLLKATLGESDDEDEENEDSEDASDAAEEVQEAEDDLAKVQLLVSQTKVQGVDVSTFETLLADAKTLLDQAKEKLTAGLLTEAEHLAEQADDKIEAVDEALGLDDDEDGDDDVAKTYKNNVAQFVHDLKSVEDAEGGIGQQVRVVAQAQNQSASVVEQSVTKIESRSKVKKFFVGPDYSNLKAVRREIAANQNRIKVLTEVADGIADPAVKSALVTQIRLLKDQNGQLTQFVIQQEKGISLFGWFVRLFS